MDLISRPTGRALVRAIAFLSIAAAAPLLAQAPPAPTTDLGTTVVTGSRLKRVTEGPAPVTVFDQEKIAELGVSSVADVLNYLPQQPFSNNEQTNFGGSRVIRLRGLNAGTTLVLINGRRTVTSALQAAASVFDVNTIPLAAVERIEVLSDSASAVYGADAVGGVVNIILKDHIEAPTLELYYGAAAGGADEQNASLAAGFATERMRLNTILNFYERDFLLGAERDRLRNQDYRALGGLDRRSANANPGNITSRTAANLPGLNSRFAAVPQGSTGIGLTPASFTATAGQVNRESLARYSSIVPESRRLGAMLLGELDVAGTAQLFGEFVYSNREDARQSASPSLNAALVPANNPFNPFGVAVSANYLFEGIGPQRNESQAETYRGVLGARGDLGSSWDWEVALLATTEQGRNVNVNELNTAAALTALASTDPATALNVFRDGPGASPERLASLILDSRVGRFESEAGQATAFVRGPLFSLPAGDVEAVLGGETRKEDVYFNSSTFVSADRYTSAAFAEVRAPLVDASMEVPALHALAVTLAGRLDEYNDFGETFNPQFGLEWRPDQRLLLRASHGTSFRPPGLFDLYEPRRTSNSNVADPTRGGAVVPVTLTLGGNEGLNAEESRSSVFGFVLTPFDSDALRISASYWDIHQDDRIQTFNAAFLLDEESRHLDRIQRAPRTPADIAAGLPGRLVSVDLSGLNQGTLDTSGVDLAVDASIETAIGRFASSLSATWVERFEIADSPEDPAIDRVGLARLLGTIPEWRGTASLGWSLQGFVVAVNGRFIAYYDDAAGLVPTGRRVRPNPVIDVRASVDFDGMGIGTAWVQGLGLSLGALNVLDEASPFSGLISTGSDPSHIDLRQRFVYASLTKAF